MRKVPETLRGNETGFKLTADAVPVMIWRWNADQQCDFVNKYWLDFTGRTMRQELGNGWLERVHPDDLDNCMSTRASAFEERRAFRNEYRLKRFDGRYRWIMSSGVSRFDRDGVFFGYIGACIDITKEKQKEEALHNVSGRLIFAQEQERSRIARELHDDTNQQLAIVAAELDLICGELFATSSALAFRVQEALKRIRDVASSVRGLALALHPAKLEHLGLISALKSLCRDMSGRKSRNICFLQQGDSRAVLPDIALCLYRVAQEAIQNVLKHSGADAADVELIARSDGIELRIQDRGKGFDQASVEGVHLGLVSMRERVRLAGGHLSINSSSAGTLVTAVIPGPYRS